MMECTFDGCDRSVESRGLCAAHYAQSRRGTQLHKVNRSPEDRFWSFVIKSDGCWRWSGAKTRNGYGDLTVGGRMVKAHRFSYELHFGKIPSGMEVRHMCHNPECTNPEHLSVGTHADNMNDSVLAQRTAAKESHPHSKLNRGDVLAIRGDRRSQRVLADIYSVDPSTINDIKNGKTWKNL